MRGLRLASAAVGTIGLGIAGYLTAVHYGGGQPVCGISHGCAVVQQSEYAQLAGVPVALLGMVGYAAILLTLLRDDEVARATTALLSLVGLGFSGWLTYVEVAKLDAICIWCVGSAVCMLVLALVSSARMLEPPPDGQPTSAPS